MEISKVKDDRGTLTEIDFNTLPFNPARVFLVGDVPVGTVRGGHAHKECEQILIALAGSIAVRLKGADAESTIICSPSSHAVAIPAGVWAEQTYLEEGSQVLVLCSQPFDPDDYIV